MFSQRPLLLLSSFSANNFPVSHTLKILPGCFVTYSSSQHEGSENSMDRVIVPDKPLRLSYMWMLRQRSGLALSGNRGASAPLQMDLCNKTGRFHLPPVGLHQEGD